MASKRSGSHVEVDTSVLQRLRMMSTPHLHQILTAAGYEMLADIKSSFGTSPDGNAYQRGNVSHVASRPGYPPNIDTGALTGSMAVNNDTPGTVIIHDGVGYGVYLELGTSDMAARPFVSPVFEKWRRSAFANFFKQQGVIPWK